MSPHPSVSSPGGDGVRRGNDEVTERVKDDPIKATG
jgi:hypothetical protein